MKYDMYIIMGIWTLLLLFNGYHKIKEWRKKKTCKHENKTITITNHVQGYRELKCDDCGEEFIDTETKPLTETRPK